MANIDKKSKCIPNNTNYFNPDKTKTNVRFSSPETYAAKRAKIRGYMTRLWYEYKYCESVSGAVYFVTFTYNDKAMPKYTISFVDRETGELHEEQFNCFNYTDLRYLLNGGLKKKLLRNYGTNFRYFVGAELGEGKGERGMHNNPHYHILFFLFPDETVTNYKPIDDAEFLHLCKMYWQGFDDVEEFRDYRDSKYGIVREGKYGIRVNGYKAINYVSKYVTKDVKLRRRERLIAASYRNMLLDLGDEDYIKEDFWRDVIQPRCNVRKGDGYEMTNDEVLDEYAPYAKILLPWESPEEQAKYDSIASMVTEMCLEDNTIKEWYKEYVKTREDDLVREKINEYRNQFCNKCRISQGLGDYALEGITDYMEPTLSIPTTRGEKSYPLNLHYYRKLYQNVVRDAEGQNIYILNDLGIQYKMYHLPEQLKNLEERTRSQVVALTPELYDKMVHNEINDSVTFSYDAFISMLNNNEKIYEDYAKFKLVYEDRFAKVQCDTLSGNIVYPTLDTLADYQRFLTPAYYDTPYSRIRCANFREAPDYGYVSYAAHPDFIRSYGCFCVFDLLADYLFIQTDNEYERKAEESAEVAKFHKQQELKDFYKKFTK